NKNKEEAIAKFVSAARKAEELNLGLNAGHDLSLENLQYFNSMIPNLLEVSIGHALISDALYFGLENTIQMYKRLLLK
ncbi:MAG: pyridoxine 5'-phosphate synthase, partial [Bacteroidales bacterium]|nr:pyridoxine 5'-phosphate synthase [Bacteroidales bacterium]